MLRIADNLDNPVEFFMQNQADIYEHAQGASTVIAAKDWDVMVAYTRNQDAVEQSVTEQDSVLGNITPRITAFGIPTPNGFVNLTSFVSAQKVADIQVDLGLEPGNDCLRHVNAPYDTIPPREYTEYFSGGMYPRSAVAGYSFNHDRKNTDHTLGALLMPKNFVKRLAQKAILDLGRDMQLKRHGRVIFVGDADRATSGATNCILAAYHESQNATAAQLETYWYRGRLGLAYYMYGYKDKELQNTFRERMAAVLPAIKQLKQELPSIGNLYNKVF